MVHKQGEGGGYILNHDTRKFFFNNSQFTQLPRVGRVPYISFKNILTSKHIFYLCLSFMNYEWGFNDILFFLFFEFYYICHLIWRLDGTVKYQFQVETIPTFLSPPSTSAYFLHCFFKFQLIAFAIDRLLMSKSLRVNTIV